MQCIVSDPSRDGALLGRFARRSDGPICLAALSCSLHGSPLATRKPINARRGAHFPFPSPFAPIARGRNPGPSRFDVCQDSCRVLYAALLSSFRVACSDVFRVQPQFADRFPVADVTAPSLGVSCFRDLVDGGAFPQDCLLLAAVARIRRSWPNASSSTPQQRNETPSEGAAKSETGNRSDPCGSTPRIPKCRCPELEILQHRKCDNYLDKHRLALATGAHWSEAESIRWSQIRPYRVEYPRTKSGRLRVLPINAGLYELILSTRQPDALDLERCFLPCYSAFREAIERTEITLPSEQMTHVLRHTFASSFLAKGGNILVLQRALGHSPLTVTMRYAHFAPDHLEEVTRLNPLSEIFVDTRKNAQIGFYLSICFFFINGAQGQN